jgi:hypothetical protein
MSLKEAIHQAVHLELDAIIITDHDQLIPVKSHPLIKIFSGEEISSYGGHILAYGIQEPIPYALEDPETIDRIHDQGGVAIAAHPFRRLLGRPHVKRREPPPWSLGERVIDLNLDGIETLNGANQHHENRHAYHVAKVIDFAAIGGSDAHRTNNIGAALTYCPCPIETIDDFLKAIRKRLTRPLLLHQRSIFSDTEVENHQKEPLSPPLNFGITKTVTATVAFNLVRSDESYHRFNNTDKDRLSLHHILLHQFDLNTQNASKILVEGPNEAYILFVEISLTELLDGLEQVRSQVEKMGHDTLTYQTISIGVVVHSKGTKLPSEITFQNLDSHLITHRAKNAVMEATRRGGNQIVLR